MQSFLSTIKKSFCSQYAIVPPVQPNSCKNLQTACHCLTFVFLSVKQVAKGAKKCLDVLATHVTHSQPQPHCSHRGFQCNKWCSKCRLITIQNSSNCSTLPFPQLFLSLSNLYRPFQSSSQPTTLLLPPISSHLWSRQELQNDMYTSSLFFKLQNCSLGINAFYFISCPACKSLSTYLLNHTPYPKMSRRMSDDVGFQDLDVFVRDCSKDPRWIWLPHGFQKAYTILSFGEKISFDDILSVSIILSSPE